MVDTIWALLKPFWVLSVFFEFCKIILGFWCHSGRLNGHSGFSREKTIWAFLEPIGARRHCGQLFAAIGPSCAFWSQSGPFGAFSILSEMEKEKTKAKLAQNWHKAPDMNPIEFL